MRVLSIALLLLGAHAFCDSGRMLSDGTRDYFDLGGEWDVQKINGIQFSYPPSPQGWIRETVPARSSPSLKADATPYGQPLSSYFTKDGAALLPVKDGAAWFRRAFVLPADLPPNRSVSLKFEGMAFKSEVWVNGKKLGGSSIGQLPLSFDVTDIVKPGPNELLVSLAGRAALIDPANKTFLAPLSGVGAGIWGKVELEFLPKVHIERVFVDTSVKAKKLTLDVRLRNDAKQAVSVQIAALVKDAKGRPQTKIDGPVVTLAPGEEKAVKVDKDWIAPNLWSPADPALYEAEVSLLSAGQRVDEKTVRFGFREFEIRGRDFYLNGERIVLLRDSQLRSLPSTRGEMFAAIRKIAGNPYNCIRPHLGFNASALLEICDELGVMVVPESAWHNSGNKFRVEARQAWLPQVEEYTRRMIEEYYNHPSVVMWNLANECLWGETDPARMEIADRIVAAARKADAGRPLDADAEVSWGGRLPVLNIHYPESSVGNSLKEKHPNSSFVFPNDFYWLSQDKMNASWRAKFRWDRPLIVGEYWFPSGEADPYSSFMGESIYDWEKWAYERLDGRGESAAKDNEFTRSRQGITDAYRVQGVAGINPWAGDGAAIMPQVAVRPLDYFPNFPAGKTAARRFVVFNDGKQSFNRMRLQVRLEKDGSTLWETVLPAQVNPGAFQIFDIPVKAPAAKVQTKANLSVRLIHETGSSDFPLSSHEEPVYVMPASSLADVDASRIRLIDPSGKTAGALAGMGLVVSPSAALSAEDLREAKVLIVGEKAGVAGQEKALLAFAAGGGSVILLPQREGQPLPPEFPETDKDHVSTRSWLRQYDHPVTRGMDDAQFSYWRPDHLVSRGTFRKPASGPGRSLLDSGGLYGLRWSPLMEVPVENGVLLLSSMGLVSKAGEEPVAATLLANLIRYAADYRPQPRSALRLLSGENVALRATLKAAGVTTEEGLAGDGPVLLDVSFSPTGAQLQELRSFLENGGHVWLRGFSSETIQRVASLFPFAPILEPRAPRILSAVRRSSDRWMDNLSSFDFAWCKVDIDARQGYFSEAKPLAALGGEVLRLPTADQGIRLLEPALLVKIPVGAGAILFDTLAWDKAFGAESEKAMRIAASLASNLGAEVRARADREKFEYFPVNLVRHANMGYVDEVANDGRGGWTDQGENDMRFFLINHTGRAGGVDAGMEIEGKIFPEKAWMAGRPFWLGDPRKQQGKSVISLRGQGHGVRLPAKAEGIRVDRKADALWFLCAAGWASAPKQEIARFEIKYADGSRERFPIRYGMEIAEWWNPTVVPGASVAWTGRNLVHSPVGIYAIRWNNPRPEKEIASIDVVADLSPSQFVVLGITGGTAGEPVATGEPIAGWMLSDFNGHIVADRFGSADLLAGDPPPGPGESGGLHFREGQRLKGKTSSLPEGGIGGEPLSLRVRFVVAEPPVGVLGGLFQAATYNENGFRLLIDKKLRIGVEVFHPEGNLYLASSESVAPGVPMDVEVRFDGTYGTLLVNGRESAAKEMPPPLRFQGEIMVGNASGKDYGFQGTISEVTLHRLPAPPAAP